MSLNVLFSSKQDRLKMKQKDKMRRNDLDATICISFNSFFLFFFVYIEIEIKCISVVLCIIIKTVNQTIVNSVTMNRMKAEFFFQIFFSFSFMKENRKKLNCSNEQTTKDEKIMQIDFQFRCYYFVFRLYCSMNIF